MNKRVLVTGGARGIGRAIVEELATAGYDVVATYNKSDNAAKEISKKFSNTQFIELDLTERKDIDNFIQQMSEGEPIDVFISNAGLWLGKPFEKMSKEELFEQIDLNFTAPARLIHGLLPVLKKSKTPMVVTISSQAANPVFPGEAMYSAAKSALSTLSQVLRAELNPEGVRIVTFEPWGVNTYGMDEPSGMITPQQLAQTVRYVIEAPAELQLEKIGLSHIKQWRGDYPDWIEK